MKGISRIDHRRTHGWLARLYRDGVTHSKMFSDGRYEHDRGKAFIAARRWLLDMQSRHPRRQLPFRTTLPRNNKTGVIGVCYTWHTTRSGERLRCYAVNYLDDEGNIRHKRFVVDDYAGKAEAFAEAVQFRRAWEREARAQSRQEKHD